MKAAKNAKCIAHLRSYIGWKFDRCKAILPGIIFRGLHHLMLELGCSPLTKTIHLITPGWNLKKAGKTEPGQRRHLAAVSESV